MDLTSCELSLYKVFKVPKYHHKKLVGWRIIEEPIPALKEEQRKLLLLLEAQHESLYAYGVKGHGALDNAKKHEDHEVIIQIDIKNFYRSVLMHYVTYALPLSVARNLRCCFVRDPKTGYHYLPTGAPTSPILANIAMKYKDEALAKLAKSYDMTYTRYMDDLTFSGAYHPKGFLRKVQSILTPYKINWKKYQSVHKGYQKAEITGVVINGDKPTVSRSKRRVLRSKLDHLAREGKALDQSTIGELNYVKSINDRQYYALATHYENRVKYYRGKPDDTARSRDSGTGPQ